MIMKNLWMYLLSCIMLVAIGGVGIAQSQPGPPDLKKMEAELKQGLDKLVTEQVITEQQAAKILQYFQKDKPNGAPPQSTDKPPQPPKDYLGQLVKDGVITADQAKAVAAVLPKPPQPQDGNNPPPPPRS